MKCNAIMLPCSICSLAEVKMENMEMRNNVLAELSKV